MRLLLGAGADAHARDDLFGKDAPAYVTGRTSVRLVQLLEAAASGEGRHTARDSKAVIISKGNDGGGE